MHLHRYTVVAVRNYRLFDDSFGYDRYGMKKTEMLRRCECGKVKVKTIDGTWTLEQIRG